MASWRGLNRVSGWGVGAVAGWATLGVAWPAMGQDGGGTRNLIQVIQAGGVVGYVLIGLSVVGVAMVVDAFIRLRREKLIPPALVEQTTDLAQRGRFTELLNRCKGEESLLGQILGRSLPEGQLGMEAIREAVEQEGEKQITRLRQRVSYIGLIASIAPVLGLLGTVIGMIRSFQVLGDAAGAARPDELAVGIAEALVTTCMGLVLAVPMLFFHAYLRDRVTQVGQEAAETCQRILRLMNAVVAQRQQQPAQQRPAGPGVGASRPEAPPNVAPGGAT